MAAAPVFASASEAMDMVHAALGYLATSDAATMTALERARCLKELEQADSVATAVRTIVLGAFAAGQDYADDGDYSPCSWLIHRTQVTKGTAADHTGWVKRGSAHPLVLAALAAKAVSKSYAREICWWTDKLPQESRQAADEILLGAAASGLDLADLAGLAAEMYERSRQDKPDDEGPDGDSDQDGGADAGPDDRTVKVSTTLGGAGVIRGALTPECAEFVRTVLDSLSAPVGADDDRSHEQRYHDALHEAMRRLIAAGLVPERAGQAVSVLAHMSLADLMLIEGSSALLEEWTGQLRARWVRHRAAAAEAGGHQGLWLDGGAAQALACDASVTPVVVGDVNLAAFGDLVRLCVEFGTFSHGADGGQPGDDGPGGSGTQAASAGTPDAGAPGAARSREALVQAIIGKAVELLSGPGGLVGFLRREQLDAPLAGRSLPLDIGYSKSIPAHIRKAVRLRARGHCEWSGGCRQPAGACQVHHTTHKANGGKTSLTGCVLLCFFHHQVMIHQRGWTLVVNPDGTTTAWNKDKTKVLHSHGPPARAG
jgi:5-methylcytosine-specific restriction endonuclease McrA